MAHKLTTIVRALPLVLACVAAAPAFAVEAEFERALQSYQSGRSADAYARFLELGLRGDPDAARIALFLGENGPLLHRSAWELTEADAASLRKAAQRPSLRKPGQSISAGFDATGVGQWPGSENLAGR